MEWRDSIGSSDIGHAGGVPEAWSSRSVELPMIENSKLIVNVFPNLKFFDLFYTVLHSALS